MWFSLLIINYLLIILQDIMSVYTIYYINNFEFRKPYFFIFFTTNHFFSDLNKININKIGRINTYQN